MRIHFVSAPAGGGKTYSILDNIADDIESGSNFILAQPTISLSQETLSALKHRFPHLFVKAINSETETGSVRRQLIEYLQSPCPEPHVLFTTWAGISEVPALANRANWNIIVDEIPTIERMFDQRLPKGHGVITDHLDTLPEGKYARLVVKPGHEDFVRKLAENQCKDEMHEVVRPLAITLRANNWESYVNAESYRNLLSGTGVHQLQVHSLLKPSVFEGYKSVTIMGACFEASLLYQAWSKAVEFIPMDIPLRYREHQNGADLTIRYCFHGSFSKHKLKADRVQDRIVGAVEELYPGSDYCWSANKDWKGPIFQGTRLPNVSNGLNGFQHFRHVVFLSAFNPKPAQIAFLCEKLAISAEAVCSPFHKQSAYQTVMRGALRVIPEAGEPPLPMTIFVPDSETALYLHGLFPGSKLEFFNVGIDDDEQKKKGRKKAYSTNAAKTAACRKRQRLDTEKEIQRIHSCQISNESCSQMIQEICNDKTITYSDFVTRFKGSIWHEKTSRYPNTHAVFQSNKGFIDFLKSEHEREAVSKEAVALISPALFNPSIVGDTFRAKDDVLFLKNVWLDFEGGDFRPSDFERIFPDIQFVAMNSYSSTEDDIRFHMCIFTDSIIGSVEAYEAITHRIREIIQESGFPLAKRGIGNDAKAHGIDSSKMHAASLFKLPCRSPDPSGRFFIERMGQGKKPLNVVDWFHDIQRHTLIVDDGPQIEVVIADHERSNRVCKAIASFEAVGSLKGEGDGALFRLAVKLKELGVPVDVAEPILWNAAAKAASPKDRRKQAHRLIEQLFL